MSTTYTRTRKGTTIITIEPDALPGPIGRNTRPERPEPYQPAETGAAPTQETAPMNNDSHEYYTPTQRAIILIGVILLICCLCGGAAYFILGHPGIS